MNPLIGRLLSSDVSMSRTTILLSIHHTTVARKLRFLAKLVKLASERKTRDLATLPKVRDVQFDDLITLEHTKCKPLSISLAVEAKTRRILGAEVSRIPASGPLAGISRRKYGHRQNERPDGLQRLFEKLRGGLDEDVRFGSDKDPLYESMVRRLFPGAVHERHKGARGCVTGLGEVKKLGFDLLYSLNHTCAMFRANINRLFRRTWCTTKRIGSLEDHIAIYIDFHNHVLLRRGTGK